MAHSDVTRASDHRASAGFLPVFAQVWALPMRISPAVPIGDDDLYELRARNRDLRIERTAREKFAPICPDFVVELCSPSDTRPDLVAKLDEWIANGAKLGWLILPAERSVGVWRPGRPTEWLSSPTRVAAHPELPGFELVPADVW